MVVVGVEAIAGAVRDAQRSGGPSRRRMRDVGWLGRPRAHVPWSRSSFRATISAPTNVCPPLRPLPPLPPLPPRSRQPPLLSLLSLLSPPLSQVPMSKPSGHSRSKSASDVRRTLFRTLARSGASSSSTNIASGNLASDIPASAAVAESAEDREFRIASEDIVTRRKDGSMDIEVPLTPSEHTQLLKELERECEFGSLSLSLSLCGPRTVLTAPVDTAEVHMKWSADDHLKRHPEELKQRLPGMSIPDSPGFGGQLSGRLSGVWLDRASTCACPLGRAGQLDF